MAGGDVVTICAVALGLAIAAAGIGKLLGRSAPWEKAVSVCELIYSALLVADPFFRPVAVAALILTASYLGYAVTRSSDDACACFGSRLPLTTKHGQVVRNFALLSLAVLLVVVLVVVTDRQTHVRILDASLGIVLAATAVGGPWMSQWVRGGVAGLER